MLKRFFLPVAFFFLLAVMFSGSVKALNLNFNQVSLDSGYKIISIASDGTYYYGIANNELSGHNRIYKFNNNGTVLNTVTDIAKKSTGSLLFSDIKYDVHDNAMVISAYGSDGVDIHIVAVDSSLSLLTNFTAWVGSVPYYNLNIPAHLVPLAVSNDGHFFFLWNNYYAGDSIWEIHKTNISGSNLGDVDAGVNPQHYICYHQNFRDLIYNSISNSIYFVCYESDGSYNKILYAEWNNTLNWDINAQLRYARLNTYSSNALSGSICLGANNEFYIVESLIEGSIPTIEVYRTSRSGVVLNETSVGYYAEYASAIVGGCVYDNTNGKLFVNDYISVSPIFYDTPELYEFNNDLSLTNLFDAPAYTETIMSNNLLKDNYQNFTMVGYIYGDTPTSAFYQFQNGLVANPCNCGSWIFSICYNSTHMEQIRNCTPIYCASQVQHALNASCSVEYCGDTSCNNGESCSTCPQDCGSCLGYCGDAICQGGENCQSCSQDCGCQSGYTCQSGTCQTSLLIFNSSKPYFFVSCVLYQNDTYGNWHVFDPLVPQSQNDLILTSCAQYNSIAPQGCSCNSISCSPCPTSEYNQQPYPDCSCSCGNICAIGYADISHSCACKSLAVDTSTWNNNPPQMFEDISSGLMSIAGQIMIPLAIIMLAIGFATVLTMIGKRALK